MSINLDHIRIVLVRTSHPGNIGSAARAMKTMGLKNLHLVNPQNFPHPKAIEMASGAADLLEGAIVTDTLEKSIADCHLVIGSSARIRNIPLPLLTVRQITETLRQESSASQVAILFGCEQSGLSNKELQRCHLHMQIPANPDYSSLNIAAALQVVAYELRIASLEKESLNQTWDFPLASTDEMEKFFCHLQNVLVQIEFLKLNAPRKLMVRLRRLFSRARPDVMELNMLRGFLTAIETSKK